MKVMSRGFSWGKQVINFSNTRNRRRVCLFLTTENKQLVNIKDDNGKLWVELIIVTFFNAVATVDVRTASNNDVNFVETQTLQFA